MRLIAFALLAVAIIAEIPKHEARSVIPGRDNETIATISSIQPPIVQSTPRPITNENCTPGKIYHNDCNSCMCLGPGYPELCTLVHCSPITDNNDVKVNEDVDVSKESKTENTPLTVEEYKKRVHDIFGDYKPIVSTTPRIITKDNCKPGEAYDDDCNSCVCPEPGHPHFCTRMECSRNANNNNVKVNEDVDVSKESKTENTPLTVEEYKKRVHDIFGDYKPIVSTTPRIITKDNCKPGEAYDDDCNSCVCPEPGHPHFCTRMECSRNANNNNVKVNEDVDVSKESKTENTPLTVEEYKKRVHDIFGDYKPIVSTTRRIITKDNCKPGEDYYDDCNRCTCSEPGYTHICTRRGC